MKIKEVCKMTNLTERTIRFYVEKQLIFPSVEIINGREYRDYSQKDISQLVLIAELRKLFFSIDDIIKILNNSGEIKNVLEQHKNALFEESTKKHEISEAIRKVDISSIHNAGELAEALKYISIGYNLPASDAEPDFGWYDSETKEEKATLSEQAWESIRRKRKSNLIVKAVIILGLLICAFTGFKIYSYQSRTITAHVSIPSIKFTKIFVDKNNKMIGQFQVLEKGLGYDEGMNRILNAKFEGNERGSILYRSILTGQKYATIGLQIEVREVTARKLGLLDNNNTLNLNIEKILADENLSREYATIVYFQGDIK